MRTWRSANFMDKVCIKALLLLLLPLSASAQTTNLTVQWYFSDFTSTPQTLRKVYVTPLFAPWLGTNFIVMGDRRTFTNDGSGSLIISNLLVPESYEVDFVGPDRVTTITNTFPLTNGFVNAAQENGRFISVGTNLPGGLVAYSETASDARYLFNNNGRGTNETFYGAFNANGAGVTNISGSNVVGAVGQATNASNLSASFAADINAKRNSLTNLNNLSLNGALIEASGVATIVTPVYTTNPLVFSGFVTVPQVNGTYYYNSGVTAWTNVVVGFGTNYLWADAVSGFWAIGTNQNDTGSFQGQIYGDTGGAGLSSILTLFAPGYAQVWTILPNGTPIDTGNLVAETVGSYNTNLVSFLTNAIPLQDSSSIIASNFVGSLDATSNGDVNASIIAPLMKTPIRQYDPFYDDVTGANVNETTYTNLAVKWSTNGQVAAGCTSWLLSDKWCSGRAANGTMTLDATRFPHGMPWLVTNMARYGMTAPWIYTSWGMNITETSCLGQPASCPSSIYSDMQQFAQWGFVGVQIDNCHHAAGGVSQGAANGLWTYSMEELRIAPAAMLASSNHMALALNAPFWPPWPYEFGAQNNYFTTWGTYDGLGVSNEMFNATYAVQQGGQFLSPGHWVYTGSCIFDQGNPTNTIWAELFTHAISGSIQKSGDTDVNGLVLATNTDIANIFRDGSGLPATLVFSNQWCEVFTRPLYGLGSQTNLVLFQNFFTSANSNLTVSSSNFLNVPSSTLMNMRDIAVGTNGQWTANFTTTVQSNCSRLFEVWPVSIATNDVPFNANQTNALAQHLSVSFWVWLTNSPAGVTVYTDQGATGNWTLTNLGPQQTSALGTNKVFIQFWLDPGARWVVTNVVASALAPQSTQKVPR